MVCRSSLLVLVTNAIALASTASISFIDARTFESFGPRGRSTVPIRTDSEKIGKKKYTVLPQFQGLTASEVGVKEVRGGNAMVSTEEQTQSFPSGIVYHSIVLVPLLLAWRSVSQNLSYELTISGILFVCLFSLKFLDAIVDDGLHLFKGAGAFFTVLLTTICIGLPFVEDFVATFFSGLTLNCGLVGKLDCIEYQIMAAIVIAAYAYRSLSANFQYQFIDMVAIAVTTALDEIWHDIYDTKKKNGKHFNQFVGFCYDSRLFSTVALVPFFMLKGYHMAVPLMIAQEYGYIVATYITTKMLDHQNRKKPN